MGKQIISKEKYPNGQAVENALDAGVSALAKAADLELKTAYSVPLETEEDGFYICDNDGNVLIRLDVLDSKNGFGENLAKAIKDIVDSNAKSDLYDTDEDGFYICEPHGKAVAVFKDGKWEFLGLEQGAKKDGGYFAKADTLTDGQEISFPSNSVKFKKKLAFSANIVTFDKIEVGHGTYRQYEGSWLVIDNTNITIYTSSSNATDEVGTQVVPHGLTIANTIQVEIDQSDVFNSPNFVQTIRLTSNGVTFTLGTNEKVSYSGNHGNIRAKSVGSRLKDVSLGWTCKGLVDGKIWLFGDSYFSLSTARWIRHLVDAGHTNCIVNGFPGANSIDGYGDFLHLMEIGKPSKVVWCLGMNDPDSETSVNADWQRYFELVKQECENNGIELIASTIPTVRGGVADDSDVPARMRVMKYKNAIIRESGLRYIDFDKAVGASEVNGEWYDGMLEDAGVHPTTKGAVTLYHRAISDVPELMNN